MSDTCPTNAILDEFVASELPTGLQQAITQHVHGCARCQQLTQRLRADQALQAQVRAVLHAGHAAEQRPTAAPVGADELQWRLDEDQRFAAALVDATIISADACDEAVRQQRAALAAGTFERLSDLLVRAGTITIPQAEYAFRLIEAPYRYCRECARRLLVFDPYPGKHVRCPDCGSDFTL